MQPPEKFRPTKENLKALEKLVLDNYDPALNLKELKEKILKIQFIGTDAVRYTLRRNGLLPREGRGSPSKLTINPFELWNADNTYWLGMMQTDGNISNVGMTLFNSELDFLRMFHVHCGVKLGEYMHLSNNKPVMRLHFGHKPTLEYLQNLGYVRDKRGGFDFQYELSYPLLRGIFDGDGYFRVRGDGKQGIELKITTGNYYLIDKLKAFCDSEGTKWTYRTKGNSGDFFILGGREGATAFLNKLYAEGQYFNKAKFDKLKFLLSDSVRETCEANWLRNQVRVAEIMGVQA